jgi:hypothetical protein
MECRWIVSQHEPLEVGRWVGCIEFNYNVWIDYVGFLLSIAMMSYVYHEARFKSIGMY